jgi:hypothetical protein
MSDPVKSAADSMTDIIDIKPPVVFGWDPKWLYLLAAVGVVLAAILVLWLWRKTKSKADTPPVPLAPPLPEDATALSLLDELGATYDIDDREYYFRLLEILRGYIDARFSLDTMEKTTEELHHVVWGMDADAQWKSGLMEMFRFADPVKFADSRAGAERRALDAAFARSFIEATRRVAAPPETGGAK